MAPLPLALALLAAWTQATPIPADAVTAAREMNKCLRNNPFFSKALPQDEYRQTFWNNACIDQRDACTLLSEAEREKVKDGYCLVCSGKPPADKTEAVCKGPSVTRATLPPPSAGEGEIRSVPLKPNPPPAAKIVPPVCHNTPGCISRYVGAAYIQGITVKDQMNMAWSASLGDRDKKDYTKCDATALRDTEHYLYHYWSRLDSKFYDHMPLTFCGISYGYSAAKWTGVWGLAKKVFTDDDKPDSEPSLEEAYWGCRGLWDAYEPEQKVAFGSCN